MELAATFYISVYSMAALAGGILAWAEYAPSVSMLTAPVAIALLFLNERYRVLRLDGIWVAIAGFAAFAYPSYEFFHGDEEFRLLSGAHLMAILQWVLLAYNKTANQYWWVCALSCLQVAIAAVLTNSPIFGIFILIYMFWALWTLSLYTLLLARLRFGRDENSPGQPSPWQWPALVRHEQGASLEVQALDGAGPTSIRATPNRSSEFRGTFQCEPHETDLSGRFVFGILGMSTVALFLGLIMFLLTPRLWIGAVNPLQDDLTGFRGRKNITGFSESVRLNDFGKILESSAPVMQLKLFDDETDTPLALADALSRVGRDELLMRGAVLAVYDRGQWVHAETRLVDDVSPGPSPFNPKPAALIRQEIRLEPLGSNSLFTLGYPVYVKVIGANFKARRQRHTGAISIAPQGMMVTPATKYTVWSSRQPTRPFAQRRFPLELPPIYSTYPERLTRLIEETNRILEPLKKTAKVTSPSQMQIAEALLTHLRDSEQFHYSLERVAVPATSDPVEEFLLNHKQGHCQYFAAALGLMLRAEKIPACVVTGFKGGIEDPDHNLIEIQQRHAHAWVEAFIDGKWVTLDPTPPDGREDSVQAVGDRFRLWYQLTNLGAGLWNDYVLNLSFTKQQQDLYGPMQEVLQTITGQAKGSAGYWGTLLQTLSQFWSNPEKWFSWQGGLIAFALMAIVILVYRAAKLGTTYLRRLLAQNHEARGETLRIAFHMRFLALMKPLGLSPEANQTQREFAVRAEAELRRLGLPEDLRQLAAEVAEAFDRMRFGQLPITDAELRELNAALERLEVHLKKSPADPDSVNRLLDSSAAADYRSQ